MQPPLITIPIDPGRDSQSRGTQMMLMELTDTAVQAALKYYEGLFASGDIEKILEGFADDVAVRYASFAPFTGKDKLRDMLGERFASMRDYRLSKRLEFLSPPRISASWTGSWVDVATGMPMELFGLEIMTVRGGKICQWSASVSTWRAGEMNIPAEAGPRPQRYSG
jgi:hypothetical protein